MDGLDAPVEALAGHTVLVVGDALLDEYVVGAELGVCREGPAPTVRVAGRDRRPGGAANVAANVAALGSDVRLLSVVGDDDDALLLRSALRRHSVADDDLVAQAGRRTPTKRRVVLDHQLLMRLDDEEAGPPSGATQDRLVDALCRLFGKADAVIVSDYGRGTVTDRVVAELALLQRRSHRVLVVDAHDITRYTAVGATAVKPNYSEVRVLLHGPSAEADRAQRVVADGGWLLSASGADVVAVTLDQDGAVVCERGQPPYRTWTRPARSVTACGAGDSYTAALACALAAGLPTPAAADLAQGAAELVAALDGTSVCTAEDLRLHLAVGRAVVMTPEDLAPVVSLHQRQGRRVVFTNGCFDLLHRGHVDLLRRAKRLGDVLVVGLNSDRSVAALKGSGRPVNALEDRAGVLAALGCVDHITAFDDPVASGVIDLLRPDVYVKGGDYTPAMLPEAAHVEAYGGAVQIMPYVQDRSTSSIIARIKS